MPEQERAEILRGFSCVDDVQITNHEPNCNDMSVCSALRELKPDVFANGGDIIAYTTRPNATSEKDGPMVARGIVDPERLDVADLGVTVRSVGEYPRLRAGEAHGFDTFVAEFLGGKKRGRTEGRGLVLGCEIVLVATREQGEHGREPTEGVPPDKTSFLLRVNQVFGLLM